MDQFHDINKFPSQEGMLVFPISMSRIGNDSQSAKTYWSYIEHINPSKINKNKTESKVGVMFMYGDFLYMYSKQEASILKSKFMNLVVQHKNAFLKLIKGHPHIILDAFSFKVWNQFYLDNDKFVFYLEKLYKLYLKDKTFQKYVAEDFANLHASNLELDENQIMFFLEEHMIFYLISKGEMKLENNFIDGKEKWILIAYPGKPLKAHIYLHQQNFFKLKNTKNKYENAWYDLSETKLYEFLKIDLKDY